MEKKNSLCPPQLTRSRPQKKQQEVQFCGVYVQGCLDISYVRKRECRYPVTPRGAGWGREGKADREGEERSRVFLCFSSCLLWTMRTGRAIETHRQSVSQEKKKYNTREARILLIELEWKKRMRSRTFTWTYTCFARTVHKHLHVDISSSLAWRQIGGCTWMRETEREKS